MGNEQGFTGGVLRIDVGLGLRGEQAVLAILKLVENAAFEPPSPGTVTHTTRVVVAESSLR